MSTSTESDKNHVNCGDELYFIDKGRKGNSSVKHNKEKTENIMKFSLSPKKIKKGDTTPKENGMTLQLSKDIDDILSDCHIPQRKPSKKTPSKTKSKPTTVISDQALPVIMQHDTEPIERKVFTFLDTDIPSSVIKIEDISVDEVSSTRSEDVDEEGDTSISTGELTI